LPCFRDILQFSLPGQKNQKNLVPDSQQLKLFSTRGDSLKYQTFQNASYRKLQDL